MVLEGFDNELIEAVAAYRREKLAEADRLRRAVAETRELGGLVTGDTIARGRAILETVGVHNQNPTFPPLFLTFIQNPQWIRPTDAALRRFRAALAATPTLYRQFISSTTAQPMAGLFELNVFAALDDAFPHTVAQPRLSGSARRGDFRIDIGGQSVYVEATVLGEGQFWDGVARRMQEQGLTTHVTSGPGPADEAHRIVIKIGEELRQTVPDAPNVIAISFFGTFPTRFARDFALADLWAGGTRYGLRSDGSRVDLTDLRRVDSIVEFSRDHLIDIHVNPNCDPAFRLTHEARERIRRAFTAPMMIR